MSGQQLWQIMSQKLKSNGGRPRIFETPEAMMEAALDYFKWSDANPLVEEKAFQFQGAPVMADLNKVRPYTLKAFLLHAGCSTQSWSDYRSRAEFSDIVNAIDDTIRTQKFDGAVAGLMNPNIIARDLGLVDKQDLTSSDGSMTPKGVGVTITAADVKAAEEAILKDI